MSESNKSQMLSEAEIIEAINADSLVSVSMGAGQPQKNVKMSTLASVAAGLIGEATPERAGLMPRSMSIVGQWGTTSLDFNDCKDLGRMYCSFGGRHTPTEGNYYWGIFNIGHSGGQWLVQIACGAYTDGVMRMYRRMFHSGTTWTPWSVF